MTASRRKYTPSIIDQIRLAGSRVGLDLAGLFEEGEGGELGFGGFVPSFTTTQTNKSRGNVLSYRPQPRATSTTEFSLTPEAAPSTMSQTTSVNLPGGDIVDPAAPITTTKPEYPDLTSLAQQYGQSSLFGGQDYIKAKEQGYSDEEILGYLRQNPSMLADVNKQGQFKGLYEQIARGEVDTSKAVTRDYARQMADFTPTEEGAQVFKEAYGYQAPKISTAFGQSGKYFGGEDLTAARQSGYSDADIKSFLEKNLDLVRGPNVPGGESEIGQLLKDLQTIAPQPVSTPSQPSQSGGDSSMALPTSSKGTTIGFSATGSTAGSDEYFGGADIRQALSEGATFEDIQEATKRYSELGKTRAGMAPGGEFYEKIMRGDFSFAQ
jgi:hypothetical protein